MKFCNSPICLVSTKDLLTVKIRNAVTDNSSLAGQKPFFGKCKNGLTQLMFKGTAKFSTILLFYSALSRPEFSHIIEIHCSSRIKECICLYLNLLEISQEFL